MNPLAVFLLAGPLIAFVTAINFALLHGDEWGLSDIARRADARHGDRRGLRADWFRAWIGLPFLTPGIRRR